VGDADKKCLIDVGLSAGLGGTGPNSRVFRPELLISDTVGMSDTTCLIDDGVSIRVSAGGTSGSPLGSLGVF